MDPSSLWHQVCDWQNLLRAHHAAKRGKRYRSAVLQFSVAAEERLIELQNQLLWKTWQPSPFREFRVIDPKPRVIQAPVYADRVVHHALVHVIEPLFERRFIFDSYACRRGKGVHAAIARLQHMLRRAKRRWGSVYVLQADIAGFFRSIPHVELIHTIGSVVSDPDVLWLCERIIRHGGAGGVGVPIGALTSQLFANVYLDRLDHWVKDRLGEPFYLRYMDDFVVLGSNPAELHGLRRRIEFWLDRELGLTIHPKTDVFPARHGIDFCGYRTWATHMLARKRNVRRARKDLKRLMDQYARGLVSLRDCQTRLASFLGYMRHCTGQKTVECIITEIRLRRAT